MIAIALLLALFFSGCINIADVNTAFRRIDRVWQLEYQRSEDELRWRVIEADLPTAYLAVRLTFIELGLPIQEESLKDRIIIAENEAPAPLTLEEWKDVAKQENIKLRDIAPWYMTISDDPKKYIVTVKATLHSYQDRALVLLDYTLDAPELRRQGVIPNKYAPPTAVKIATNKFWLALKKQLEHMNVKEPRRRQEKEFEI